MDSTPPTKSSESFGMVAIVVAIVFIFIGLLFMKGFKSSRGGGGGGGGGGGSVLSTPEPNPTVSNVKINSISISETDSTIPSDTVNVKLEITGTAFTNTITKQQLQSTFNWIFGTTLNHDTDYTLVVTYLPSNITKNINFRTPVITINFVTSTTLFLQTNKNLDGEYLSIFCVKESQQPDENNNNILLNSDAKQKLLVGSNFNLQRPLEPNTNYTLSIDISDMLPLYVQPFTTPSSSLYFLGNLFPELSNSERIINIDYAGILQTDSYVMQAINSTDNTVLGTTQKTNVDFLGKNHIGITSSMFTPNIRFDQDHYIRLIFYRQGETTEYLTYDTNSGKGDASQF